MTNTTQPAPLSPPHAESKSKDGALPLPPLLPGLPIVGSLPAFRKAPHDMLERACREHGDTVRMMFGPVQLVVVRHPNDIEHVLQKNRANWVKDGSPAYENMKLLLGDGLVTAEGATWLKHRRLVQPAFHRERLAGFMATMQQESEHTAARFGHAASSSGTIDIADEMMRYTQRVVLRTILGVDLNDEAMASRIAGALEVALHFINDRTNSLVPLPMALPLPSHQAFKRAREVLNHDVQRIIEQKRRTREHTPAAPERGDVLDMLMDAVDEDTGAVLDDRELFDEVMTMFLAGHETTSNLLSWTFALLGQNPHVTERVVAELASLPPHPHAAMKAPVLMGVIHESLRLRPPVWLVDRVALHDDVLGGYHIKKGTVALVAPWVVHRDERWWPEPERFDPDRFLPDVERQRPKLAYIPFIAGQRKCIGDQFALMEASIALAHWLPRFDVEPLAMPEEEPTITMRPLGGLPSRIRQR